MASATAISFVQKDTVDLSFTITSDGTTAVDTSAATCEFKVRNAAGTDLIDLSQADAQITVGTGASSNVITVELGTSDTNITAGQHTYSFQLTVSSEIETYIGTCTVAESIH